MGEGEGGTRKEEVRERERERERERVRVREGEGYILDFTAFTSHIEGFSLALLRTNFLFDVFGFSESL